MTYGFDDRDYSLEKIEDSYTPQKPLFDLSGFSPETPMASAIRAFSSPIAQAGYRGIGSGLSLLPEAIGGEELDSPLDTRTVFDYIIDGAAERATAMRLKNEEFAKKQGLGGGIAYGLTYGLAGFAGALGSPALYGKALASARKKSELAAGVDPITASRIGTVEGVTGAVGALVPFFGKNLVQRLGFGAAANIIPGIGQRAAEGVVFGDKYANRAPEVFDPVAIAVDGVLGGAFGALANIADKPAGITDADIADALDLNVQAKMMDSAPGKPTEAGFAIQQKIMDEMLAARREYRQPDFSALKAAEFSDSPEQIQQMRDALDEIEVWRGEYDSVKMTAGEVSAARSQIDPLYSRVLNEVSATKLYTPEQSQQFAKLTSRIYNTLARRTGRTAEDLSEQFPLKTVMDAVEGFSERMFQRAEGLLPSPSTLTMPDVPTPDVMQQFSRVEKVPLSKAVSFQAARIAEPRESKALVEGYGDMPVAVKLRTGEFVIYDGNHRTDAALDRGDETLDMYVVDAERYDPQNAGRAPAKEKMTDDELLAELGTLNQSAVKDLYVGHNISETGIRKVLEIGGLAAPSLGISRTTTGGFGGYGDITLLAEKGILESRGARTFNADVYSPRQPRPVYKLDSKKLAEFIDKANSMPMAENRGARQVDEAEVSRYGAEALARIDGVQMLYLSEIGQLPKPKRKVVDAIVKQAAKLPNANQSYNLRENPKFQELAKKYFDNLIGERNEAGGRSKDSLRESIFDSDGALNRNVLDSFARDVQSYVDSGGLDFAEYRSAIAKKFRTDEQSQAYSRWLEEKGAGFITGKQLQITPSRKVPYTLENVVEQMTREIRGGEGFNYGAGNIRAMNAAEITSIQEVQNRRGEIVSAEEFKKLKDESNEKLMSTLEKLKPFYKYDSESWGYINDASAAIAEGAKGWRTAFKLNNQSEKIIRDYISYVKNLPTEYFETKMQRAVGLGEFKAAVVPKGTAPDILEALKNAGLSITTYDSKKDGGRISAIAKSKDLLFQQNRGGYSPDEQVIKLTEISDPSTFVHELGHHVFEMMGKLAADANAPKQIKDDFRALVEHGGMKVEDWYGSSVNQRREAHERIAEDFEAYLMDGSAPTPALKNMFAMIKDWMLAVYKTFKDSVKPEIAAVFDRMLATDQQLAMKAMTPDYAAIAKRTSAVADMKVDDFIAEVTATLDPESTVMLEGKEVKVADLLEDDPAVKEESEAMIKLVECMLNVR